MKYLVGGIAGAVFLILGVGIFLLPNHYRENVGAQTNPAPNNNNPEDRSKFSNRIPKSIIDHVASGKTAKPKSLTEGDKKELNIISSGIDWVEIENYRTNSENSSYAWFALILSWFGLLVTAAGIWYVRETLVATSMAADAAIKANQISQSSAENASRAWCYCKVGSSAVVGISIGSEITPLKAFKFSFRILNRGETPAQKINIAFKFVSLGKFQTFPSAEEIIKLFDGYESNYIEGERATLLPHQESDFTLTSSISPVTENANEILAQGFTLAELYPELLKNHITDYMVVSMIRYQTVFSDNERISLGFYYIDALDDGYNFSLSEMEQFRALK